MQQLTKEEILNQLLGLSGVELLEIETTIQLMNKLGISNTSKSEDKKVTTNKAKNATTKINVHNKRKTELEKSVINLKHDSVEKARFSQGLSCVKCGCVEGIIKNGRRKNGQQKYKCKNCGSYFSEAQDTILSGTHKSIEVWETFMWCMNEGYTVRKAAKKCGIHKNTSWMWRHKVLNSLREEEEVTLGGIIEADDTFFLLSYKGNHKNKGIFYDLYGRKARHRGGENSVSGVSHEQACVACGVDRSSHTYSRLSGTANINAKRVKEVFSGVIQKESVLCVDGTNAYNKFAKENRLELVKILSEEKKKGIYNLGRVNAYHTGLKQFVSRYKGVATKYLNNYLMWYTWTKVKKMEDELRIGVMLETALEYIGKIRYCDVVLGAV